MLRRGRAPRGPCDRRPAGVRAGWPWCPRAARRSGRPGEAGTPSMPRGTGARYLVAPPHRAVQVSDRRTGRPCCPFGTRRDQRSGQHCVPGGVSDLVAAVVADDGVRTWCRPTHHRAEGRSGRRTTALGTRRRWSCAPPFRVERGPKEQGSLGVPHAVTCTRRRPVLVTGHHHQRRTNPTIRIAEPHATATAPARWRPDVDGVMALIMNCDGAEHRDDERRGGVDVPRSGDHLCSRSSSSRAGDGGVEGAHETRRRVHPRRARRRCLPDHSRANDQ